MWRRPVAVLPIGLGRMCHAAAPPSDSTLSRTLCDVLETVSRRIPTTGDHRVPAVQLLKLVQEHAPQETAAAATLESLRAAIVSMPKTFSLHDDVVDASGTAVVRRWEVSRRTTEPTEPTTTSRGEMRESVERSSAAASQSASQQLEQRQDNSRATKMEAQLRQALRRSSDADRDNGFVSLRRMVKDLRWSREDYEFVLTNVLPRVLGQVPQDALASPPPSTSSSVLQGLEARPVLRLRPKLKRRGCHVFTDGDGLSKAEAQRLLSVMAVEHKLSTHTVVRHTSTGSHSVQDVVTTYDLPPYLILEKNARSLIMQGPPVLKPIVFLCSDARFDVYARSVAPKLAPCLEHACVYVVSPGRVERFAHNDNDIRE